jgi:uncharacterized protein (TIGR02271 family)
MTEHIVAIYDSDASADAAARDLAQAGVVGDSVRRYRPEASSYNRDAARELQPQPRTTGSAGGFWSWLLGEEDAVEAQRSRFPADADYFERGASRGRAVVSVTVSDASEADRVVAILNRHDPLHVDEDQGAPAAASAADPGGRSTPSGEQVIPLAEEQLEIGKRSVDRGVTRVRRYVVDRPVEKDVTLHGERVTIERRRPIEGAPADHNAFEERTVEVRETEEVPVVSKRARVVEEVAIRKEATERTEHVQDTVRKDEVEFTGDRNRVNPQSVE